jgi:3-phenylpropionate/cinnamic acid dioxygenase small subunit
MSDAERDLREIEALMVRYATMVDGRQWELMDSVFAEGATIDYTSTGGRQGPYRETLQWLDRALAPWPTNLHFVSNLAVEVQGDRARSRCYFLAPMARAKADGSQEVITNAGVYHDALVRTRNGWRIAERVCEQTLRIGQLPKGYAIPE